MSVIPANLRRSGHGTREQWDDECGHLTFTTMVGDNARDRGELTSGLCAVPPAGFLAAHAHEAAEIYYVLAGEAHVTVDAREQLLRCGDMLHIPPLVRHAIRNDGNETFEFVFTYAADSMEDPRVAYRN
jgi:quercetin dioxygenase-like cupin family protein